MKALRDSNHNGDHEMKIGFVLCSRLDSERVPRKALKKINGLPIIEHLIGRLKQAGYPVFLAVPDEQTAEFEYLKQKYEIGFFTGYADDPLARTYHCAKDNKLDVICRVTHDKIFVDPFTVREAISVFDTKDLDYLYSSTFVEGTGFEIISFRALEKAAQKFSKVEFIGYAIRLVTDHIFNFTPRMQSDVRLLIDFPEDVSLIEVILSRLGNECSIVEVIRYLENRPTIGSINSLPILTVYTCAHLAGEYIDRCMKSVSRQVGFEAMEYILIDDFSSDSTTEKIAMFCAKTPNAKWFRNEENIGLASSSNVALKKARGKYIIRIDADDFFTSVNSCNDLMRELIESDKEAVYPNNYFGDYDKIQKGRDSHHVGGALFDRRAINFIKFTDGLRGHEGYDFFERAKDKLQIGYYNKETFFYTQREDSMSHTNLEERAQIKEQINESLGI